MLEWSQESGVPGDLYKPESFGVLSRLYEDGMSAGERWAVIEVTYRGVFIFGRGLMRRLADELPPDSLYDPLRRPAYALEFVLLEVVSARIVKQR